MTFVSHASKDAWFVRLLVKLLEFHGIEFWYSTSNLKGGDDFPARINTALAEVDLMLAVVSSNSLESQWVFHEIKTFQRLRPSGRLIPLIIDNVDLTKLSGLGLSDIQYVDFTECLLLGFESVFNVFNQVFLKPRQVQPRAKTDRRKTSTRERLRYSFWTAYRDKTGLGEGDNVEHLFYSKMMQLVEICSIAASSYDFASRIDGTPMASNEVVDQAVREVWSQLKHRPQRAVILIESVAEFIWERYEVVAADRRPARQRTTAAHSGD